MQVIRLPIAWTIVLDSVAWSVIQPGIAYLCMQIPVVALDHRRWLFKMRAWEREGRTYERLFLVKKWKAVLPSAGTIFRGGFSMRHVVSRRREHLERWVAETCRAEFTHWIAMLPAGLFFLWNPFPIGVAMVLYAVGVNLPCIVVQRYNRPRLLRIMRAARGQPPVSTPVAGEYTGPPVSTPVVPRLRGGPE